MKLDRSKAWYERQIALEANMEVGAGAPPTYPSPVAEASLKPADTRIAFGTFVGFWRRNRGWNAETLAKEAGVYPEQILEIEHNPQVEPEPNAVCRLAQVFKMPAKVLLELAGLTEPQTAKLREEAVRFAARSESVAALSQQEREAFEAFMTAIMKTAREQT